MKTGKAPGFDSVCSEHVKYGGACLLGHLHKLFNYILETKHVPKGMKLGVVVTLQKDAKKSSTDPNNYRGITLLPILYKIMENLILARIKESFVATDTVFPDPLQNAYQKSLSCVNLSMTLQECIRFNVERGSKVYAAFLDTSKAFDVVWHQGLFVKLHEAGISDALWQVIVAAYSGMESQVRVNGTLSRRFVVRQSVRQGGVLSPLLYVLFIDGLIKQLRASGIGAYVGDIYCGILVQADDVALLSLTPNDLQYMLDICFQYSINWRYKLNATKTKIIVFGETIRMYNKLCKLRQFKLGANLVEETLSIKHVGVILTKMLDSKDIVHNACQKGRGSFAAIVGFGARSHSLNPITAGKLYKQVIIPTVLYGAELWGHLPAREILELERMQRLCLKVSQGLRKTTRSDMCHSLLGMPRISAFVDKSALLFVQRLCSLPEHAVSKMVFVHRLAQTDIPRADNRSVVYHLVSLMESYGLSESIINFKDNGEFPTKAAWRAKVMDVLVQSERQAFMLRTMHDPDFTRFHQIQPDCFTPCAAWVAAKVIPDSLPLFSFIVKLIVSPPESTVPGSEPRLCELCGLTYSDSMTHRVVMCSSFCDVREQFWDFVTDKFPLEVARYLHNLPDDELC